MAELTKKDIQQIVRDTIASEFDKKYTPLKKIESIVKELEEKLTKEQVKQILARVFKEQSKFMWEKSSYITQFLDRA